MLETGKIFLFALGAALLYGIVLDQVTTRVSLEYFTVAHPAVVASQSPTEIALAWGTRAAGTVGLVLGALLALSARVGRRPRRRASELTGPVAQVMVAAAAGALIGGIAGYLAARAGWVRLPEPLAGRIEPSRHARFFAVYGATLASYTVGISGGLWLCLSTWRARAWIEGTRPRPRDRIGVVLFYGSLVGLLFVVLAPLAFAWVATSVMMRPPWYAYSGPEQPLSPGGVRDPHSDLGLDYENVAFETEGGAILRGWLLPAAARRRSAAIVLAGGGWSDRRSILGLAPPLHQAGYTVLVFDYRDRGASDGSGRGASYGLRESKDVSAAVRFLSKQGFERIAVIGYSMGGTAAILAAAQDPRIDAVAAVTPGTTLLDLLSTAPETARAPSWLRTAIARLFLLRVGAPLGAVASLRVGPLYVVDRLAPRPLLVLQGQDDALNSLADAERLMARAGAPKELVVVPGTAHLDVLDEPSGGVVRHILAFLERALAEPPGR